MQRTAIMGITMRRDGLIVGGSDRTDPMPEAIFRLKHLNALNTPAKYRKMTG